MCTFEFYRLIALAGRMQNLQNHFIASVISIRYMCNNQIKDNITFRPPPLARTKIPHECILLYLNNGLL